MDYRQFMNFLESGNENGRESIQSLEEYIKEFPYFQSAHLLLAKSMHEHQHVRFEKQLKIAAAYAGNRKFLYDLIHFKQNQVLPEQAVISESPFIIEPEEEEVEIVNVEIVNEEIIDDEIKHIVIPPVEEANPNIPANEFSGNIFSSSPNLMNEDEPFADEFNEEPVADPHDIIRKRLVEILGLKEEQKEDINSSADSIKVDFTPKNQEIDVEYKTSQPDIENEIPVEIENEIPDTESDILDVLVGESSKKVDFIEAAELEHALESTLIQSIEKLPLIDVKKETKKVAEPLEVNKSISFYDWLKIKSTGDFGRIEEVHAYDEEIKSSNEIRPVETPELTGDYSHKMAEKAGDVSRLIDRFIETEPRILPSKAEFYSPATQAKRSITENEDVVSETLAKIYYQQGNYLKARSSYQKLSLLYPDKLAYFAALISEIDKAINNQDKQNL